MREGMDNELWGRYFEALAVTVKEQFKGKKVIVVMDNHMCHQSVYTREIVVR